MLVTLFKILQSSQRQNSKLREKFNGFTLIELLVAIIIAGIVITSLLGFMVNILTTERKERAKVASQQEIQAALEYMVQDLQEAVYVYDATGLNSGNTSATTPVAIRQRIPPVRPVAGCNTVANCEPILVFWKRRFLERGDTVRGVQVGSVTGGNDTYVYSLVAYYLINNAGDPTWSGAARIARFEIEDGIPNPNNNTFLISPDSGFVPFSLTDGSNLIQAMNNWAGTTIPTRYSTIATQAYQPGNLQVLVDFVDDTPFSDPTIRHAIRTDPTQGILDCRDPARGGMGGDLTSATNPGAQRIPANFNTATSLQTSSFYICVNSATSSVRLYLRGNALARLTPNRNRRLVNNLNLTFLPTSDVRVFGRGFFGNNNQ